MVENEMTEKVFDSENWKIEAEAVAKDIKKHVKKIVVLDGTNQHIFFNVTTIEGAEFCIELCGHGFRVVGQSSDQEDDSEEYFETPYSLLGQISPSFHKSFGNELKKKLTDLSKDND